MGHREREQSEQHRPVRLSSPGHEHRQCGGSGHDHHADREVEQTCGWSGSQEADCQSHVEGSQDRARDGGATGPGHVSTVGTEGLVRGPCQHGPQSRGSHDPRPRRASYRRGIVQRPPTGGSNDHHLNRPHRRRHGSCPHRVRPAPCRRCGDGRRGCHHRCPGRHPPVGRPHEQLLRRPAPVRHPARGSRRSVGEHHRRWARSRSSRSAPRSPPATWRRRAGGSPRWSVRCSPWPAVSSSRWGASAS